MGDTDTLTPKQKRFLDFILDYSRQYGCNPSQTEIARHFKLSSLGSVQTYIKILEQKGFISREQNAVRGLKVLPKNRMLPLLGKVAAGLPIEHNIHHEEIEVPSTMVSESERPHFALEVSDMAPLVSLESAACEEHHRRQPDGCSEHPDRTDSGRHRSASGSFATT